jgi:hypothetical protein
MQQVSTPVVVTADGDYLDLGTPNATGYLGGASMIGAGTAVIRSGGSGGAVIAVLGAAAALADHWTPTIKAKYVTKVHVTLTGTPAHVVLYPV